MTARYQYQSLFYATVREHIPAATDTKATMVQQQRNGVFYVVLAKSL
jgi:hypothetical protein